MTAQEIDRIECAIRHIQTAVDIDPWAVEIAIDAMDKQIPKWIPVSSGILPEANEKDENGFTKAYLVQDARWMDVARWDGKFWIAWAYGTLLMNVVAWMPLPEAYWGDDHDEG